MPRENSFTDSEGRSITPDLDEEFDIPHVSSPPQSPIEPRPQLSVILPSNDEKPGGNTDGLPQTIASAPGGLPSREPSRLSIRMPSTPADRFRNSVRKVIQMHRTSSVISGRSLGVGAEPGADPRRQSAFLHYGHIRQNCTIEIIDYSSTNVMAGKMTNTEFIDLLRSGKAFKREPWVKVRWINIGGISWDVISALGLQYNMHPLALEDVLQQHGHSRSKADYYHQHLFLRILSHSLASDHESVSPAFTDLPRSASPIDMQDSLNDKMNAFSKNSEEDDGTVYGTSSGYSTRKSRRGGVLKRAESSRFGSMKADVESRAPVMQENQRSDSFVKNRSRQRDAMTIEELKKGGRVNVKIEPICIFLFRDGTVISISPTPSLESTAPITARLRQRDTTLRLSADASLLVQSLLDLIVDRALEVVDEYQGKLLKLEHDVLVKPNMKTVRYLHIISGDLILHKRTLEPIKTVVYGLRRYDVDRCLALIDTSKTDGKNVKVEGFMSHKSKIYLADVFDHMEYILASMDMFANIAENLINYTFNMTSYQMNEVMRRLTMATIIFLPLTLLTGYFGMNFSPFWSVDNNSDLFFWEIAIPVMIVVIPLFLWSDFVRMWHYIQKKMLSRQLHKSIKQD